MTDDLTRRIQEHKQKIFPGFTARYNINKLIYVETLHMCEEAVKREKYLKGWLRSKKEALISQSNPDWVEISVPSKISLNEAQLQYSAPADISFAIAQDKV